jgi:hypothetical protein
LYNYGRSKRLGFIRNIPRIDDSTPLNYTLYHQ